eukprot:CAMPEP_0202694512 /NCGR_PEP_ID=MMETSP1385-20130828/8356_1 /ASSEMBLY_ACC=CAM_ASM_000861 /TAXON_ID=933848 /ORGANISM="Elphidium margaritaceum" /LENGTH=300 /DNA_ID=CAMNT_0049350375 /DNA_START=149 /DNA_END=1051 /DNA_ORIENTATION=+
MPTESICGNLSLYREEWDALKQSQGFDDAHSFTFSWNCAPCPPRGCLDSNKYIVVQNNAIESVAISKLNDDGKRQQCNNDLTAATNASNYQTIDKLYQITIDWCNAGINDPEYKIIALVLNREYFYPMTVKLLHSQSYIAYDISCFAPHAHEDEDTVCDLDDSDQQWSFWISKEMQEFLGWSMIFLILTACSLGYCINWLKKKKSEKIEKWREKEEKQKEERDKEKAEKRAKRKAKAKRKSSKVKHRSHLEKHRKRDANDAQLAAEYASVPPHDDASSEEEVDPEHANHINHVVEEYTDQ